ncbi:hypothetical protein ACR739_05965, partial [Bifidobacterium longum subsp. longum]
GFVPSFPIAVCFVWRQKIVHRTRAMSLSQALNQFAQNLGRYPSLSAEAEPHPDCWTEEIQIR